MSTEQNQTGRLSPQSMLQQRYIIVEQAGRGGMGAVYKATDTRIANRRVAIKEMSQAQLGEEELAHAIARFQQEAAMLGTLSHTNLPRIYDAFSEQGRSYLVMDFIDGKTLHQILKEANGQPLPVAQVVFYAQQLCDVLSYLHTRQPPIIFRDIKPTNIMILPNNHLYLVDFGIARVFKEGQVQDTILLGSPGYAPPEQHGLGQTSPRSDLYGLGATLHFCLSGRDPYYNHNNNFSFPPIRQFNQQVPIELDTLIQRMLAPEVQQRPSDAIEVQQALLKLSQKADDSTSALSPATVSAQNSAGAPTQYVPPRPTPPANNHAGRQAPPASPMPTVATGAQQPAYPAYIAQPVRVPAAPISPWTGGFTLLFGLILAGTVGISALALNFVCPSPHIIEAMFSVFLILVAGIAVIGAHGLLAKGIFLLVGVATLVASTAFITQALPDFSAVRFIDPSSSCNVPPAFLPADLEAYNYLFTGGLAIANLASLYWFTLRTSPTNRAILAALLVAPLLCIVFQFTLADTNPVKHILLNILLIMLTLGTLLASRLKQSMQAH